MKNRYQCGLIQYPIDKDPLKTTKLAFKYLNKMAAKQVAVVVLPEMWLGGPSHRRELDKWVKIYKKNLENVRLWSRKHRTNIFFSQLEKKSQQCFNTAYWINDKGEIKGKYQKIHLFRFEGEHKIYTPGNEVKVWTSQLGKIGLIICYDVRFPELTRKMTFKGLNVLIVCAQWPSIRRDHWLALLKARSIENQIYVIAVNRLGIKQLSSNQKPLQYEGDSVVIDPWGVEILHLKSNKNMGVATIDLPLISKIRKSHPFLKDGVIK